MVVPNVMKKMSLTEKLLYFYGKSLGLSPFTLDDVTIFKFSLFGLFYGIILSTALIWIFWKAMESRFQTRFPGETTMLMMANCFGDVLHFASVYLTWIIFAFHQNRIRTIVEFFIKTSVTAFKLGIVQRDRDKFFKKLATHVFAVNVSFLSYLLVDHGLLYLQINFKNATYFFIFNGSLVVCRNLVILYLDVLLIIRDRFRRLNEATSNLTNNGRCIRHVTSLRTGCSKITSLRDRIEMVGQLHRELIELAETIMDFVSVPLLAVITMNFFQLVSGLYDVSLLIFKFEFMELQEIVNMAVCLIWLCVNIFESLFIVVICDSTCKEADRTATVLHEMWIDNNNTSIECSRMVNLVSLSLVKNRLNLTLYGFFDLDLTLIYKISGTTTTYMIILMQLDQQHAERYKKISLRSSHFH